MEFNLKTWNGLEVICQTENSLFRTAIPKQMKIVECGFPRGSILGPLLFFYFRKRPQQLD